MRGLAVFLCVIAGCTWTTERRVLPETPTGPSTSESLDTFLEPPIAEPEQPKSLLGDVDVPDASAPMIRIHDIVGVSPAEAGVMFAEATDAMEACLRSEPGVMRVRLTSEGDAVRFKVDPASTVDAGTGGCVLRALSVADPTVSAEQATTASEAPKRIESQLTISWH